MFSIKISLHKILSQINLNFDMSDCDVVTQENKYKTWCLPFNLYHVHHLKYTSSGC